MKSLKTGLKIIFLSIILSALAACATIEGIGKDVEKAGEVVQDAAND